MSDFECSDSDEDERSYNEIDFLFNQAANHVQQMHQHISPAELLQLYALYKQATVGKCNTSKPGLFQMQARIKWQQWMELMDMSKEEAKHEYVNKLKTLDKSWYERIASQMQSNKNTTKVGWVVHSTLQKLHEEDVDDIDKTAVDWIQKKDLQGLKAHIQKQTAEMAELLAAHDQEGMGLVHWAADSNAVEILKYLMDCGANINMQDENQQTPLHYAATCGHRECIELLMQHGADWKILNDENKSCLDVAENAEIRQFIESLI